MLVTNQLESLVMRTVHVRKESAVPGSQCNSCRHAHIIVGYRESETVVYCNYIWEQAIVIPFKVRECSSYADKNKPTWEQMKSLALPIKETTSAKTTGFKIPVLVPEADGDDEDEVAEEE